MNPIALKSNEHFLYQETTNKWVLFSIYSLFLLLPWYHNTSGQIQPVDLNILITFLLITFSKQFFAISLIPYSRVYSTLVIFLIYAIMRLIIGYIGTGNEDILYSAIEHGYHIVLLLTFVALLFYFFNSLTLTKFHDTLLYCLCFATLLPFATMLVQGTGYYRAQLTFNNANQLGFYALVNLCCFYYLALFAHTNGISIKKIAALFVVNANILFLFLCESRAASVAIVLGVLSFPFIFQFKLSKGLKTTIWVVICLIGMIFIAKHLFNYMQLSRGDMANISLANLYDDIYVRAFDGIDYNLTSLIYFIFGNGEESNPLRLDRLEFHNNFMFIFNQLGLIGLLIYLYLVFTILIGLFRKGILYTLPFFCYLFYSNLQYAFRTRSNWLLFAMIIFVLLYSRKNTKRVQPICVE